MMNASTFCMLALLSCLLSGIAHAGKPFRALETYVSIQEKLAEDSLDGVKQKAQLFSNSTPDAALKKVAKELAEAKDIAQARSRFKALSSALIQRSKEELPSDYEIAYCPMAGAKWIQKVGAIRNPYYGNEMLSCGEKVK